MEPGSTQPRFRCCPPKVRQDEIAVLNAEQARMLLSAARGDRFECLYTLALMCGMRRGELLGLKWSDIDLSARTLRINRQLQRRRDGRGLVFTQPKNSSRQTIRLPQRATNALRSHRKKQLEEQLRASTYQDQGLVFATKMGTPLDAQNVVKHSFKPLLKKAGLGDMPFHSLRHTYATLLLSKGTHPTYVQNLLGHKSVSLTLDLYSHWMPPMGEQTAITMEEALS